MRNRVLLANLTGGELRLICDQRREASGQVRQRRVSDSAAVSVAGIITFGTQAQGWVEALPAERQDGLFRDVADAIAERLGTTLYPQQLDAPLPRRPLRRHHRELHREFGDGERPRGLQ
ncbi:hypothetical protein [Ancylobacter vacuolatus]|uniref:Uncharacterized protein n=1 Tax=Ancylobacter vacuolatus TaxID=223389 RepID=A0ABU0DMI0_9HYPH|nr:hypothetical protein [Ancylobacter vacuolatus]MDQ0349420.1 hypothetical protein [Ancylobacter vacuolatus]